MPGPQPKLHLRFPDWPERDKLLWQRARANDDLFGDAPGAQLAPATLHTRFMAWRRFLGFLTLYHPELLALEAERRLTLDVVRLYAKHIAETNTPYSTAGQVDALYAAARTMMPNADWGWLREVKARLYAAAPRTPKGPVITSVQLIDLGLELMAEAECEQMSMADAVKYRDGLIIALWGYVPLRHKNMAALELGRDVLEEGDTWSIVIPPEDNKTGVHIEFDFPETLREPFLVYLSRVRPRMLRRQSQALWVSYKGGPLAYSALGPVMTRHTTERLGIRVTPHDARDAAATTWAIAAPAQVGIARDLLGQSDLRMTTKHHNRARGVEASRAHRQVIAEVRRNGERQ
jgi:integrase/recombinase XerD